MKLSNLVKCAFAATVFLAGCTAEEPTNYVGPSGKTVTSVKCKSSPQSCFIEANKICQGPYSVISSESHAGGILADILPGPVTWYGMTLECGKANGIEPNFPFRGSQYIAPVTINQTTRLQTSCTTTGMFTNCN